MAAYAALTSLMHIIHNLQNHPSPPISIDKQQVQSLTEIVTFLQEFLQGYISHLAYSDEADPLETRIADAAYAVEDVIESKIVDQIRKQSTVHGQTTSDDLYQDLRRVIGEMDLVKKAAMTTETNNTAFRPQPQRNVSIGIGSSTSLSTGKKNTMVGFDDVFLEVLESLMGSPLNLQIIPITGMGGIGKTTLAQNLFQNASVKERFDIRAWTTISQVFNVEKALKELLNQAKGNSSGESENELGLELYQYLSGRRYIVVMDDMWSIEVWDKIKRFFPNYKDGSRVIVTTRQSDLASHLNSSCFNMKFLDEISSWHLFSKTVFGEENFRLELEDIGKEIVTKCRGLPLSIVSIGGLLAKSEKTREYWEYIEGNLNSIVNSKDDEHCLRILKMSYSHLPIHLKPCFLYMGMYKEDHKICVSTLIKLWVSDGILQPTSEKTLETVGEENLKNLIERNLILVHQLGSTGNIKYCKVHDLLRDLCLREAEKERFVGVVRTHIPRGINSMRRIVIHGNKSKLDIAEYITHVRSFVSEYITHVRSFVSDYDEFFEHPMLLKLRLLRILEAYGLINFQETLLELVNLRHLSLDAVDVSQFPSSLNHLWNLHSVIIDLVECVSAPTEIWNMPHLRHVKFPSGVNLPDPPTDHVVIMENLQTLKKIVDFKFNGEVVKRVPNVKKLSMEYEEIESNEDDCCLNYLEHLNKLESFKCFAGFLKVDDFLKKLTFPQSLKKLSLDFNFYFELEEVLEKASSLPLLQKLKLEGGFFGTGEWETAEGQFLKLEILTLVRCDSLEKWTSQSSHFPLLKEIRLEYLRELKEISSEIGDISTLREIVLVGCSESAVMCLKEIVEEQEELQGEEELSFHVRVIKKEKGEALHELAGTNFEVMDY